MFTTLRYVEENKIATITFNRPEVHNAFNEIFIQEFRQCLRDIQQSSTIAIVIIQATGTYFCAGGDVQWMQRMIHFSAQENLADAQQLAALLWELDTLNKPTLALVQGGAFGGGLGLLAVCDMVIAAEDTRFALTEVKLGLIPAVISPYVLRAMGERQARRYFLSAEIFSAQQAMTMNLVHQIVPAEQLAPAGAAWTQQLLQNGPQAVQHSKKLIAELVYQPINAEVQLKTATLIAQHRISAEGQEGLTAFLAKRKPKWS